MGGWAPAYCTADELAHYVGEASSSDPEMTLAVETASRSVDHACGRQFGLVESPQVRYYTASCDRRARRWEIPVDDFATVDGLVVESVVDGVGTGLAGVLPSPVNAVVDGSVWTHLVIASGSPISPSTAEDGVRVTARWGWPQIPPAIKLATLIQASRLFARRNAPFGVAGNLDVGEMRLLERLDVDLMTSVRPYARVWGAV